MLSLGLSPTVESSVRAAPCDFWDAL
jgi:hypothetical protein